LVRRRDLIVNNPPKLNRKEEERMIENIGHRMRKKLLYVGCEYFT